MTPTLEKKKEAAIEALRELHVDSSGPVSDNLDAMEEVIEEAGGFLQALRSDCEKKGYL